MSNPRSNNKDKNDASSDEGFESVDERTPLVVDNIDTVFIQHTKLDPMGMMLLKNKMNDGIAQTRGVQATPAQSVLDDNSYRVPLQALTALHNSHTLKLHPNNPKFSSIPVVIEIVNEKPLVKVGPCDLSGVGGHQVREEIIKQVVQHAYTEQKTAHPKWPEYSWDALHVSACIGVRGRAQMVQSAFFNNRAKPGSHMNAYIKIAGEKTLTHWEPRKGPQSFFNDTICAVATTAATAIFEDGIRQGLIGEKDSNDRMIGSHEATRIILKSSVLKKLCKQYLDDAKKPNRVSNIVSAIGQMAKNLPDLIKAYRNYLTIRDVKPRK